MDEPVCFVRSHREMAHDFMPALVPGYRRLEPGWLDAAVNRAVLVLKNRGFHLLGADLHALRSALFPPSEPEPEEWEREAARAWNREAVQKIRASEIARGDAGYEDALARHFAKARRAREGKP